MRHRRGVTLVEAIIGFAGLGILLLMIYTLLIGGVKNWSTMIPQINARGIAREILYGKTGEEWGGLVSEIQECNIRIRPESPAEGIPVAIPTSPTALNLETYYATGTLVGTIAICYEWSGYPERDELDNSVSKIGTLTKIIWRLPPGTTTGWKFISKKICATNIRMGSVTYPSGNCYYPLFKYYTGLGIEISPDQITNAVINNNVHQIGINMIFDIDNDRDGKFGEDPAGIKGNQDNDNKLDEDRPDDFRMKTKVACINLNLPHQP